MKKKEKTCLLIDTGIPDDSIANTKENEKLSPKNWRWRSAGCGK
jgi:hypothetical protein